MNGGLKELVREIGIKAPVPVGALILVYFIVSMFLTHLHHSEVRFSEIFEKARTGLDANTAAMNALVVRLEASNQANRLEHKELELDLEELRSGRRTQ